MFISDLLFGCKNSKLCSIILIDAVKKNLFLGSRKRHETLTKALETDHF